VQEEEEQEERVLPTSETPAAVLQQPRLHLLSAVHHPGCTFPAGRAKAPENREF